MVVRGIPGQCLPPYNCPEHSEQVLHDQSISSLLPTSPSSVQLYIALPSPEGCRRAGSRGRIKQVYALDCCEKRVSGVRGTFTFKALRSLYKIRSGLLRHSYFKWLYPPTWSRSHVRTGNTTDLYSLCYKPDDAFHQILSIRTIAAGRWKGYDHRLTMLCLPDFLAMTNKGQMIHLKINTRQIDKISLLRDFLIRFLIGSFFLSVIYSGTKIIYFL